MRDRKKTQRDTEAEAEIVLMGLQVRNPQGAGEKLGEERHGDYPCEPLKGTNPVTTLILNF